jgi:hypothetical protein
MESFMGRHQIGIDGEYEAKQRRRIGIKKKSIASFFFLFCFPSEPLNYFFNTCHVSMKKTGKLEVSSTGADLDSSKAGGK